MRVCLQEAMNDEFYQEMPDYDGTRQADKKPISRGKSKYNRENNTERHRRWRNRHPTQRREWMAKYMANRRKKENERL